MPTNFMHQANYLLSNLLSLKSYVLLPIIIFCFSLIFRLPVRKAVKSSLTIGIGFIGIFIIFGYFVARIAPAVESLLKRTGLHFNVLDVGWPPLAAVTWSFKFVSILIPLIMVVNILMLVFRKTRTFNIDIWNYWHFIFAGMLVYDATHSALWSIAAVLISSVVIIKIADWSAEGVKRFAGLEGISIPTLSAAVYYPVGVLGDRLLEKIPGIRSLQANPESLKKRLGLLGEPMIIGLMMGLALGIGAGYSIKKILELGFEVAAVIYILPMMTSILGQGLNGISEGMKTFIKSKFPNVGETYIGLDVAVIVGNTSIIVTGLLLMPVALILAFALPGIRFIPLGDLANVVCPVALIVVATRGNIVRSFILGIPVIIGKLYAASYMAPVYTRLARNAHVSLNGYHGVITGFLDGGNLFRVWLLNIFQGHLWAWIALPFVALALYFSRPRQSDRAEANNLNL
ncbi:MAG TPA: PTS transporter subunit IIC [Bacillota bacterium]|nr:PTS transporter subunit IIC [Bacillota bacterium]